MQIHNRFENSLEEQKFSLMKETLFQESSKKSLSWNSVRNVSKEKGRHTIHYSLFHLQQYFEVPSKFLLSELNPFDKLEDELLQWHHASKSGHSHKQRTLGFWSLHPHMEPENFKILAPNSKYGQICCQANLKFERFIEDRIERFPVDFGFIFPFPFWQQIQFDVWIRGASNVHGRQVFALNDMNSEYARCEVIFHLETDFNWYYYFMNISTFRNTLYSIFPKYFFFFLPLESVGTVEGSTSSFLMSPSISSGAWKIKFLLIFDARHMI